MRPLILLLLMVALCILAGVLTPIGAKIMSKKLVNFEVNIGPYVFRDHMFVEADADEQLLAQSYFGNGDQVGEPEGEGFVFPKCPGEPRVRVASVLEVEDQMAELVQSLVRC